MTASIHNNVFDAALNYIKSTAVEAEVREADETVLATVTLNSGNYTGPADNAGAGGGRKLTCLVSDAGDMSNIAVDAAGDATKVVLTDGDSVPAILISTDITDAPKSLGASDQINLGTFDVILKDPT
jgi:hypothetical protein